MQLEMYICEVRNWLVGPTKVDLKIPRPVFQVNFQIVLNFDHGRPIPNYIAEQCCCIIILPWHSLTIFIARFNSFCRCNYVN